MRLIFVPAFIAMVCAASACNFTVRDTSNPCYGIAEPHVVLFDGGCTTAAEDAGTTDIAHERIDAPDVVDTGIDTGVDTGPCNGGCDGGVCQVSSNTCVACYSTSVSDAGVGDASTPIDGASTDASDAGGDGGVMPPRAADPGCASGARPYCHAAGTATAACAECATDADCRTSTRPRCDPTGTCAPCTATFCTGVRDVCDTSEASATSGACVECVSPTDCPGGHACRPNRTCAENAPGSVRECGACSTDSECSVGACISTTFRGSAAGVYCLSALTGDAGTCSRPFRSAAATSVDGRATSYCILNQLSSTCVALLDMRAPKSCSSHSECGVPGIDDGYCPTAGPRAGLCTLGCVDGSDCPATLATCSSDGCAP